MYVLLKCLVIQSLTPLKPSPQQLYTNLFSKLICFILQPVILPVYENHKLFIYFYMSFCPTHHNPLPHAPLALPLIVVSLQQRYQFPSAGLKTESSPQTFSI